MKPYNLAVAYRIYPLVSKPALGLPFSDNKLVLSEICLKSFKQSLGSLRAKIWVLLDGCSEEYSELFLKYFDPHDVVLLRLPAVGNHATFGKQIDILLEQEDSDLVYFAEDDYVYLPDRFAEMIDFIRSCDDVDFVTPYDHLDSYTLKIHRRPNWTRVCAGRHWRTVGSTCLTFLTKKETLRKHQNTFRSYCRRNYDSSLWLGLTKQSVFQPLQAVRFLAQEPFFAKVIAKAWFYGWRQILFGQRMKLWTPIPGIATHLNKNALSPAIDWVSIIEGLSNHPLPVELRNAQAKFHPSLQFNPPRTLS